MLIQVRFPRSSPATRIAPPPGVCKLKNLGLTLSLEVGGLLVVTSGRGIPRGGSRVVDEDGTAVTRDPNAMVRGFVRDADGMIRHREGAHHAEVGCLQH
jgi:hypothetical protein